MAASPLRVVKIGGSLFELPNLATALNELLASASQADAHLVLVAGGGRFADVVRAADRAQYLVAEAAHWLAIDAMSLAARLLGALLPQYPLVTSMAELRLRLGRPGVSIFDAREFLREVEPQSAGLSLPASWDVTSDSIAARLAIVLDAEALVLLKSQPPPAPSLRGLADCGYVDAFLPHLARELRELAVVDFRGDRAWRRIDLQ